MSLKDYQEELKELLQNTFQSEAKQEWSSRMNPNCYSPKLDVAVGPYSIENGVSLNEEYDQLFDKNVLVIREMIRLHLFNIGYINTNTYANFIFSLKTVKSCLYIVCLQNGNHKIL